MDTDWPRSLHTLYTPRQVRMVLHRERLRCDRTGRPLSAVVFDLPGGTRRQLRRLARIVLRRARATDEVGWMSDKQLCAALPETTPDGAERFALGVRDRAAERGLNATFAVYRYPEDDSTHWNGGKPANGAAAARARARDQREAVTSAGPFAHAASATGTAVALDRRAVMRAVGDGMAPASRLHALPLRRLLGTGVPAWKRGMDILGALVGLTLSAPVMAVAALLIRASSPGPVIFRQPRGPRRASGSRSSNSARWCPTPRSSRPRCAARSEQDGPAFKMANDPRVTLVGRFLRSHESRRTAAVVERAGGQHVAGRPAPAAGGGVRRLRRLAPPPTGRDARPDVHLAGARPVARQVRRLDADGHGVHPPTARSCTDLKILLLTHPGGDPPARVH